MSSTIPTTAPVVLGNARSQLGIKESPFGSNRTKYGRKYGRDGQSWCAMFVWWVFLVSGFDLRTIAPGLEWTPTFSDRLAQAGWRRVPADQAAPGDVVFFDFPDSVHRIQHVGIVEKRVGDLLTCIEGNTSRTSNDNGGAVMRQQRRAHLAVAVYRPPYQQEDDVSQADVEKALRNGKVVPNRSWKKGQPEADRELSVVTVLSQLEDDGDVLRRGATAHAAELASVRTELARQTRALAEMSETLVAIQRRLP